MLMNGKVATDSENVNCSGTY